MKKEKLNDYQEHEIENKGDYKVDTTKLSDILFKIAAVLIAFMIWLYAGAQEDVNKSLTFKDIPVDILTSGNYSILNSYDYTVDVTVSGRTRELNKLSADSFSATADATGITSAGKYTLDINVSYPGSAELVDQSVTNIVAEFDVTSTVTVPVDIVITGYDISEPYEMGEPSADVSEIQITGPGELVKQVSSAQVTITAGHLESTTTYGGTLAAADENGDVLSSSSLTLSQTDVTVTVPVLMNKVVTLKTVYKYGYFNSSNVVVSIEPASIVLKGEVSVLDAINDITLGVIDEKMLLTDTITREIKIPDGTVNASGVSVATLTVTLLNTADRVVTVDNIDYYNPDGLNFEALADSVDITVRGTQQYIYYVTSGNITVTADLSGVEAGQGTVSVPLTITLSSAYSSSCYELGSYSININV